MKETENEPSKSNNNSLPTDNSSNRTSYFRAKLKQNRKFTTNAADVMYFTTQSD